MRLRPAYPKESSAVQLGFPSRNAESQVIEMKLQVRKIKAAGKAGNCRRSHPSHECVVPVNAKEVTGIHRMY